MLVWGVPLGKGRKGAEQKRSPAEKLDGVIWWPGLGG